MDYDRAAISPGGGVWARTDKSVPLSAEVRAALGVDAAALDPDELVRAILRAPVDLLWNGGIGTFVKSSDETHAEAGDRDTDAVRVDGRELRARVVGEGGNLGLTQRGRIEYAAAGGHINTDAIDNSAGVDCSDHEVNIKILLGAAVARGRLTLDERDTLLAAAADEVCELVLYDNYLQAQILSQEQEIAPQRVEAHEMLMHELELEGLLDRELEALPATDVLAERQRQGRGLTRPELAVLLAYAKRSLYPKVLASAIPDDPALDAVLRTYFPRRITDATGELYREHRLRREIVATFVTNDVVNSLGIAWAWQMMAETGAEAAEVVRSYWIAREVTGAVARWEEVEALFADPAVDTDVQMDVMGGVDGLVEGVSRWYLQHASEGEAAGVIARDRASFSELSQTLRGVGSDAWRADHALRREALAERGVPLALAEAAAWRPELTYAPDVIAAARATGCSLAEAAHAFFALGEKLHMDWIEEQLERDRRRDALAALGARRGARRAARDAARPHRAGHRRRSRRADGRGGRALPGRARRRPSPASSASSPACARTAWRIPRPPWSASARCGARSRERAEPRARRPGADRRPARVLRRGRPAAHPGRADGARAAAPARSRRRARRTCPIIHIRHEEAPGAPVFAADGPLVETMPDVAPQGLEPIVTKHAPGSFTDTELSAVLSQFGVRKPRDRRLHDAHVLRLDGPPGGRARPRRRSS